MTDCAPSLTDKAAEPADVGSIPAERAKPQSRGIRTYIVTSHDFIAHRGPKSALRERARLSKLFPDATFRVLRLSRTNTVDAPKNADRISLFPAVATFSELPPPEPLTDSAMQKAIALNVEHYLRRAAVVEHGEDCIPDVAAEIGRIAVATFNIENVENKDA